MDTVWLPPLEFVAASHPDASACGQCGRAAYTPLFADDLSLRFTICANRFKQFADGIEQLLVAADAMRTMRAQHQP